MKDFRNLNNLIELKQSLQELKGENINLLDIYDQTNNSYFADLLTSPLMTTQNPSKVLQAISDAELAFNISANPQLLQNLFMNNFFCGSIKKQHDKAVKILASDFQLTATDQVQAGQTVFERFIQQTSNMRLVKTLKNLVEANLLSDGVPAQDALSLLPLNAAQTLAAQITDDGQLREVVSLLKGTYNLNEFACTILNSWSVPTDLSLKAFSNQGINIDFNLPSQDGVSGTPLQILANKNIPHPDLGRVLDAMSEHTVNWEQNFNGGMHPGRNFMAAFFQQNNYMQPEQLLPVVKAFAKNKIDLGIKDQNHHTAFYDIVNKLNHGADINKYFVQAIAKSGTKFADVFIAFRDKVKISDILKAYEGQEIDFNTPSQELGVAMTHPAGFMVPIGMFAPATTLLKELFGYVNDQQQFKKVVKQLKAYENIDWGQQLNGMNGDNIFSKIAAFDNIQNNIVQLFQTAKNNYGLTFKLNSTAILTQIVDQINYNQEPEEIIKTIEELRFEVNKGLMAFVFADRKNIALSVAADLFPGAQLAEASIQDLPMIARMITKDNNPWTMQASFNKLIALGFNQWTADFGNGQQFLGNIIQNCFDLQQVEWALSILSKANDLPWDFSHKDTTNQDVFDFVFMKPSYPNAITNIVKLLAKFENIDWVEASNKMLNSPMIQMYPMQLVDFVALLPEEKIDLLKVVNGTTLIANLLSRVGDNYELQALMLMFKDKFKVDMNSKIGMTEDHILSFIPQHLLHLDNLLPVLQNLGINIDWLSTNQPGTPLFVKILQNSQQNIQVNLNYLMANVNQAQWTQPLDNEQNNLPLLIAKSGNQNWNIVINLLKKVDEQNNSLFHINYKNTLGMRLMDMAESLHANKAGNANAVIKELRDLGSVEPQKPISVAIADKLDLTNERLDGYKPNKINAPKIINLLYQKFPLSEQQVTQEISNYKGKDFAGWNNSKWHGMHNQLTIPQVIDLLSGMTNVHDRLPENWSFKKVLGHIIHAVRTSNDEGLSNSLTHCLSDLHLCDLGKLINLLNVVQDRVLEGQQVNYAGQEFGVFKPILDEAIIKIKAALIDKAPAAVTKWFYDIYGNVAPEKWGMHTIKIQGIINKVFTELGDPKIESYHFNDGLKAQIITPLIEKIKPGSIANEQVAEWQTVLQEGISIGVNAFFEKVVETAIDGMDDLFDDLSYNAENFYGNFSTIGKGMIAFYHNKIHKQNEEKGLKFLELLKINCTLNPESAMLVDQSIPEHEGKFDFSDLPVKQVQKLLDTGDEALIHWLASDKVVIDWTAVIGDNHTVLTQLAHMQEGKYAQDAINLFNAHLDWQISHNILEAGKVDEFFGDLN